MSKDGCGAKARRPLSPPNPPLSFYKGPFGGGARGGGVEMQMHGCSHTLDRLGGRRIEFASRDRCTLHILGCLRYGARADKYPMRGPCIVTRT